jgi:hypothetical protein
VFWRELYISLAFLVDRKVRKEYLMQFTPVTPSRKFNVLGNCVCDKGFKMLFGVSNDLVASLKRNEGRRASHTGGKGKFNMTDICYNILYRFDLYCLLAAERKRQLRWSRGNESGLTKEDAVFYFLQDVCNLYEHMPDSEEVHVHFSRKSFFYDVRAFAKFSCIL